MKGIKINNIKLLRIVLFVAIIAGIIFSVCLSSIVVEADHTNLRPTHNEESSKNKPTKDKDSKSGNVEDKTGGKTKEEDDASVKPAVTPTPTVTPIPTPSPTPKVVHNEQDNSEKKNDNTPKPTEKPAQHKYEPSKDQVAFNNMVFGNKEKTAYLTFDDGPTPKITSQILDILREEDVKATFFVIGQSAKQYPNLVRQVYDEGHGIGNHTYSHNFDYIYSSRINYMNDLQRAEKVLKSILGEDKEFKVTRFPGGSFGDKLAPYRSLVNKYGYTFVDWNCVNGDAETVKIRTKEELLERFKSTVRGQTNLVVLMHDAPKKTTTVEALPEIIQYLKKQGYRFELIPWTR